MKDIRDYLKKQPLLFDGGMGTYYASRNRSFRGAFSFSAHIGPPSGSGPRYSSSMLTPSTVASFAR